MKIKSSKSFDYLQTTGKVNVKEPKVKGVVRKYSAGYPSLSRTVKSQIKVINIFLNTIRLTPSYAKYSRSQNYLILCLLKRLME